MTEQLLVPQTSILHPATLRPASGPSSKARNARSPEMFEVPKYGRGHWRTPPPSFPFPDVGDIRRCILKIHFLPTPLLALFLFD